MEFGKRRLDSPGQFSSRSGDDGSATANFRQSRGTEPNQHLDLVDLALLGGAFIAIAACAVVYFGGPASQPTAVAAASPPAPIVTSDVAPMDTIRQRMTTGESGRTFDFAIVASPSARCFARINSERPWRHPGWTNRALEEPDSLLKFEYEVAGRALNCLMTEDQDRFCKVGERAKIAKAVTFYLAKYRRDAAAQQRASAVPDTARGQMFKDLAGRMNDMDSGAHDDDGVDDAAQLFRAVESVTAVGYFTAADFGASPPPELAPHIRAPFSQPCG